MAKSAVFFLADATPVLIASGKNGGRFVVRNDGGNTAFLGDAGVTSSNGYSLQVGGQVELSRASHDELYAAAADDLSTTTVNVLSTDADI